MESSNTIELATALSFAVTVVSFTLFATWLGYLGGKWIGAFVLSLEAIVAAVLSIGGAWWGYTWASTTGAWIGLLVGIFLAMLLVAFIFSRITGVGRSGRFAAGVWLGFCILCFVGYLSGGWLGLLTLTLPAIAVFWLGLFRISAYILPLRDKSQRRQAFRCLLTFSMGTNYPYYFVDGDNKVEKRVEGNPYRQFFAGPGITYLDCEHAAYISDGVFRNREFGPGLNFTSIYDLEPKVIDLKPQLRAFKVEALTREGIPIQVGTFISYQIDPGRKTVALGQSFPFRPGAIQDIVRSELTERRSDKRDKESGLQHTWDGGPKDGLVPLLGTRIIQDIISRYTVDKLCAQPDPENELQAEISRNFSPSLMILPPVPDPKDDSRFKIVDEFRRRMKALLQPMGLQLIGGGISNLKPQDDIAERRLDSWRTQWEREILRLMAQGQAKATEYIQTARAEAEANVVMKLNQVIQKSRSNGVTSGTALALRFIDALGEIVTESNQWPLPPGIEETWKRLRGELEQGQSSISS